MPSPMAKQHVVDTLFDVIGGTFGTVATSKLLSYTGQYRNYVYRQSG